MVMVRKKRGGRKEDIENDYRLVDVYAQSVSGFSDRALAVSFVRGWSTSLTFEPENTDLIADFYISGLCLSPLSDLLLLVRVEKFTLRTLFRFD